MYIAKVIIFFFAQLFRHIVYKDFAKPQNWRRNVWDLDREDESNNGLQNEDLIVWMRTAALPTFRKLYRRLDRSRAGFQSGLQAGNYTMRIQYSKLPAHFRWYGPANETIIF